jgi:hypothetical protein
MATKYLLSYHGGSVPTTEAEGAKIMAAWVAWFEKLGQAIIDPGNPVAKAVTVASNGATSDGGGSNPVTGYSMILAESIDQAVALTKDCPILAAGGSIEISETFATM